MLRNISYVALILSLIISKQRVFSSVSPPLTEEGPLFVFSPPTMLNAQDTLNSKPCSRQAVHFARGRIFLYQIIQLVICAELAQARTFLEPRNLFCLQIFKPLFKRLGSYNSSQVFFQETPAKFRTLAVRQNEYYPQVPRRVEEC